MNYFIADTHFGHKAKKILAIIKNKDFYYSDVKMTKEDFLPVQRIC